MNPSSVQLSTAAARPAKPSKPSEQSEQSEQSELSELSELTESWPVLVVGAGPAGLAAAITLARAGVRTLVVNRRTEISAFPRATVLSLRTMELIRSWGLHDRIMAGGHDVQWRMLEAPSLTGLASGRSIDVGYPTKAASARISPTRPAAVPQDHLEQVLLDHLRELPAARILTGVAATEIRQGETGCETTLIELASGRSRIIVSRYLVGADGPRSVVRSAVGIGVTASSEEFEALAVVIRAPLWKVVGDRRFGIYVVDGEAGSGTFLPAGQDDRWVYAFNGRADTMSVDELVQQTRIAAGVPDLPVRVLDVSRFRFSAAMADSFRSQDVFLVGDAAHRVTPRGGTGLNTAIADGVNLGWKLGWVLDGWAPERLLDSYEAERRPIAEHTMTRSLDPRGSRRDHRQEVPFDLAGRVEHRWTRIGGELCSTIDLTSRGLTLLTESRWPEPDVRPGVTAPVVIHQLDRRTATALGVGRHGLLLRPDGIPWHPAGLAEPESWTDSRQPAVQVGR